MLENPWLTFSMFFLLTWVVIWIAMPKERQKMFWVSIFTMPFGLTEPIFVPEYWNPPSLFNLAATTGFDIESLIFCFAIGGIASVIYTFVCKKDIVKLGKKMRMGHQHRFHKLALASPVIAFIPLYLFGGMNPIYPAILSMLIGSVATSLCRPDLKRSMLIGGAVFLALYFAFFFFLEVIYPGTVESVWNLSAISGILVLGVPLEELLFAITFGMFWSSAYEHVLWYGHAKKK